MTHSAVVRAHEVRSFRVNMTHNMCLISRSADGKCSTESTTTITSLAHRRTGYRKPKTFFIDKPKGAFNGFSTTARTLITNSFHSFSQIFTNSSQPTQTGQHFLLLSRQAHRLWWISTWRSVSWWTANDWWFRETISSFALTSHSRGSAGSLTHFSPRVWSAACLDSWLSD